ncbi:hypothetical protein VTL71DRAFT_353 [Oculimacula yallundae]|uniref:Uncharacterized protein n=1 Tax=Oculimacula yallundae TaxID=86028 RepID=A0ABR4CZX1_9HELO
MTFFFLPIILDISERNFFFFFFFLPSSSFRSTPVVAVKSMPSLPTSTWSETQNMKKWIVNVVTEVDAGTVYLSLELSLEHLPTDSEVSESRYLLVLRGTDSLHVSLGSLGYSYLGILDNS